MRGIRKTAFHDTAVMQHHGGVRAEELADFKQGDHVMTVDGFPGRVVSVLFGPFQGTESYQVELDGGMGGGDYNPGQLRPYNKATASRVEAAEVTAAFPVEAVTDHTANMDYPELEDILERRLPNENIKIFAAVNKDDEASEPDSSQEDPGENLEQEQPEEAVPHSVDDPDADPLAAEQTSQTADNIKPPDACSFCGHNEFEDPQMTGRGVRMRCSQCKGTMKSWGGQWEPEFPNSSQNHASETWDYRSGGPGGVVQAPGANFKSSALDRADKGFVWESLQTQSGIMHFVYDHIYRQMKKRQEADAAPAWWIPPTNQLGTTTQGPAQYNLVTPKTVLGSVSELNDVEWQWHFTASWMDVQEKARRIRKENHVKIVAANRMSVVAEVQGDTNVYETQLNYLPGTKKVADWACGCKWASYSWGRSPRFRRFEGRLCSHALATQYEANARGIFGRDVRPDAVRPDWQEATSPVVVRYDKATQDHLSRPAEVPFGRHTFSSKIIDSDGVYPDPELWDLQHPPVYATIQTMIDNEAVWTDVFSTVASLGVDQEEGRALISEAILSDLIERGSLGHPDGGENVSALLLEASKKHRRKPVVRHDYPFSWQHHYTPGYWPCGTCLGIGCDHCQGTGQLPQDHPNAIDPNPDPGGNVSSGSVDGGTTAASHVDAFDYGHDSGYDFADRLHAHNDGFADVHPGEYEEAKQHHVNSWFDKHNRVHVGDGFDHGYSTYVNEHERGLPHRGGSTKTADYASADPFAGMDGGAGYHVKIPHSNSQNPGSTGWATSQDPQDWGRSLITNNFGVTFDASLHVSYDRTTHLKCDFCGEIHGHDDFRETEDGKYKCSNCEMKDFWDKRKPPVTSATHPKGEDGPTVSGVALKAADSGRVLMIQRSHKDEKDPARGTWEFPGGHHEEGDLTSLHAGIREWEEEVGQPFPEGGHVTHVHRSGPYALHTVVIPSEDGVKFHEGRSTVNPDDPDGDDHEQSAWWDPSHAAKNPALRSELKKSNPFGDIKKAAHYLTFDEVRAIARAEEERTGKTSEQLLREHVAWQESFFKGASEDYRMQHRPGGPGDGEEEGTAAPAHALDQVFPKDVYDKPHFYGTGTGLYGGEKAFKDTIHTLRSIRGNPEAPVTMYRSLPPEHAHEGFKPGDWVSVHHDYARGHGLHHEDEKEDWPVIKATVPAKHLWNNGDSLDEFGYHGPHITHHEIAFPGGENAARRLRMHSSLDAPMTDAALDFESRLYDGTLHDEPEPALPSTDGAEEEVVPTEMAGNTRDGEHGDYDFNDGTMNTNASISKIIEDFQNSKAAKLLKESMKDFTFSEQQELINEGKGDRARNFHDLKIADTHYALIGDSDDDETILWV